MDTSKPRIIARPTQNALRHGLTRISVRRPEYAQDVRDIAEMIYDGDQEPELFEAAVRVAECDVLIREIRRYRVWLLKLPKDSLEEPFAGPATKHRPRLPKRRSLPQREDAALLVGAVTVKSSARSNALLHDASMKSGTPRTKSAGIALHGALAHLVGLERYERRAWSRRKRAVLDYIAIRMGLRAVKAEQFGLFADAFTQRRCTPELLKDSIQPTI